MGNQKLKALVHFIIHECADNPGRLGAVRLNKILWFTDMLTYQTRGATATGEKYLKRRQGPVPATILQTLDELEAEGKIQIDEPSRIYETRKFVSLDSPDISLLLDEDRDLAMYVIEKVCEQTASEVSEVSHDEAWDAASDGEEIPMCATLAVGRGAITPEIRAWAESEFERLSA